MLYNFFLFHHSISRRYLEVSSERILRRQSLAARYCFMQYPNHDYQAL